MKINEDIIEGECFGEKKFKWRNSIFNSRLEAEDARFRSKIREEFDKKFGLFDYERAFFATNYYQIKEFMKEMEQWEPKK
ncbi:MAG: hypothetical protein ACFFAO_12460 [Candidatus Hermodarchaeota archaeon]